MEHGFDDLSDWFEKRFTNLFASNNHFLRQTRNHVLSANVERQFLLERCSAANLDLDALCSLLTNHQTVVLLHVVDDRFIELVTRDAQ